MKRDDALWKAILEDIFEDETTQCRTTMGIEQFLLERAKKEGLGQGVEQGIEQEKRVLVSRLLTKTQFTSEQIADIVDVSVAVVDQIRKDRHPNRVGRFYP